jgi:hypothetical protein
MKKFIQLGLLAALAGGSIHGATVNFTGSGSAVSSFTPTASGVTVTGYFYNAGGSSWVSTNVQSDSTGTGVAGIAGLANAVEGTWQEYLLLDFGGTLTGTVQIDTLVLNYPTNDPTANPVIAPQSPFFKYAWISAAPSGATPSTGSLTNWTTAGVAPTAPSDLYTFSTIPASGRYLLLGAVNGSLSTSNYFQLNSLTYTSVPDGASTLALMGAALATLGFAARRRKL